MRRGAEAVHFLPAPIDPGSEVTVKVDWKRRWDHMQQHSGDFNRSSGGSCFEEQRSKMDGEYLNAPYKMLPLQ